MSRLGSYLCRKGRHKWGPVQRTDHNMEFLADESYKPFWDQLFLGRNFFNYYMKCKRCGKFCICNYEGQKYICDNRGNLYEHNV